MHIVRFRVFKDAANSFNAVSLILKTDTRKWKIVQPLFSK